MGFRKLINSKKLFSLLAVFMLSGTSVLMAQTSETGPASATDAAAADKSAMWLGIGYYVLLFLLVCFAVAIVGKILKVYDLSQQIQGKKQLNWNNVMAVLCIAFLVVGLYGAYWSFTVQGTQLLPEAASVHGVKMDEMFNVTTGITMVVFFVTQILLFTFIFAYKYSKKRKAYYLPHNNTIEKVWTIAPAIVLTILVVFGFFSWQQFTNTTEVKGDLNIEVTGHQFAWELRYPGKDGKLGAINYQLITGNNNLGIDYKDKNSFDDLRADTLVIPVNHSIRLNIRAQDVIHSCYIPNFRVQMNAVPGLPTYFKFIPTITTAEMRQKLDQPDFEYMLYCNKICGGSHYNMKKIVRVVTEAEYQQWIAQQKPYLTDAVKKDLKLAGTNVPNSTSSNRLALNN
ncbi:MAG: cytochrome c oxidase subunit II [Mucilaginibacter sp.]